MARNKKTPFHSYETKLKNGGVEKHYTRLTHSQLMDMQEQQVSFSAITVYIYMKHYAAGKPETQYPYRVYKTLISKNGFQSAIKELADKGYIEYISGKANKQANIYKFSNEWTKKE